MSEIPEEREGRIWLERGIAAARAGRRAEARQALFRALNFESQREMCWLWLAAVSEDAQQERVYLKKVLTINPNSRFARAGLAHLDAQAAQNGAAVTPAGAGALGLLEPEPTPAAPEPATEAAPEPASTSAPPAPDPQPAQITAQESEVVPIESANRLQPHPAAAPSDQQPATARESAPVLERPVAPPATPTVRPPAPGKSSEVELSGWTVETKTVKPARPAEVKQEVEPSGWTRSIPRAEAAPRPRAPKYEVNAVQDAPAVRAPARVGFSGAMSEVFQSHETWTAVSATVSLAGLAVILIALAIMSVLGR